MKESLIIVLLLVLIFKDLLLGLIKKMPKKYQRIKTEPISEEQRIKQERLREEFDNIMSYSIKDAIDSERVN